MSRAAPPVRPFGWPVILVLLGVLAIRWSWGALRSPPPVGLRAVPAGIVLGMLVSSAVVVAAVLLGPDSPHRRGGTGA